MNPHTGFSRFFSVPLTHTQLTHHDQQRHTPHNTTTHTTPHGEDETRREKMKDKRREYREKRREKTRREKKQDKRREDREKRREKTRKVVPARHVSLKLAVHNNMWEKHVVMCVKPPRRRRSIRRVERAPPVHVFTLLSKYHQHMVNSHLPQLTPVPYKYRARRALHARPRLFFPGRWEGHMLPWSRSRRRITTRTTPNKRSRTPPKKAVGKGDKDSQMHVVPLEDSDTDRDL